MKCLRGIPPRIYLPVVTLPQIPGGTMESLLYAGLDVHKEWITIVVFRNDEQIPYINIRKKNEPHGVKKYFLYPCIFTFTLFTIQGLTPI